MSTWRRGTTARIGPDTLGHPHESLCDPPAGDYFVPAVRCVYTQVTYAAGDHLELRSTSCRSCSRMESESRFAGGGARALAEGRVAALLPEIRLALAAVWSRTDSALAAVVTEIQGSSAPRFPLGEWPAAHHCVRCFTFDLAPLAELAVGRRGRACTRGGCARDGCMARRGATAAGTRSGGSAPLTVTPLPRVRHPTPAAAHRGAPRRSVHRKRRRVGSARTSVPR